MKRLLFILLCLFLLVGTVVFAADLGDVLPGDGDQPTIIVQYQGSRAITDSLASKSSGEKNPILSAATETALKDVKYPYTISGTEITILKFRCDKDMQICGYWISATRKGEEVATNSPIWISPPPYEVFISSSFDAKAFTSTVILKEDPKEAVEQVLQRYVSGQPLGKAITGTPA
jgi:hypothetical protein